MDYLSSSISYKLVASICGYIVAISLYAATLLTVNGIFGINDVLPFVATVIGGSLVGFAVSTVVTVALIYAFYGMKSYEF